MFYTNIIYLLYLSKYVLIEFFFIFYSRIKIFYYLYRVKLKNQLMATGSKNVVAIQNATESIETLTKMFKSKRISYEAFVEGINKNLSDMTSKRDYIQYLKNIGYYDKLNK